MKYPRDEIWFRRAFKEDVLSGRLRVLYRPDNRVCRKGKEKCFNEGEIVKVRILRKPGDEERNIEPVFCRGVRKARIKKLSVVDIDSLGKRDFEDSWEFVNSAKDLKYFLALLYNKSPSVFKKATKIELEYLR